MGEGVGTHWQLLNFSEQLGTASQVWVVAMAVNGDGGGGEGGEVAEGCGHALGASKYSLNT